MKEDVLRPVVLVALPFAYQDGIDKYNGIMRYLREADADWDLVIVRDTLNVRQFRRQLAKSISGVICGTGGYFGKTSEEPNVLSECLRICQERKLPLVALDWQVEDFGSRPLTKCVFINIDSEKIGRVAAAALMKAGEYASYGFVGMHNDIKWSRNRGAFFARELRKGGNYNVKIFKGNMLSYPDAVAKWLASLAKPSAVFAANDSIADIVLKACSRNGIRVPEELSVIGVDDDPVFCVHTRPTLTSVHPDFEEMGYVAAQELSKMFAGGKGGRKLVIAGKPTVTCRMSTAPCTSSGMMVRRVDEIIESRACQKIDSNVIADELRISRRLLDLRYRQLRGISVREAIVRTRIKRAKYLLDYSGHDIGTICGMCGYASESYLGRVFIEREGISMSEYRARNKKDSKGKSE